MVTQSGDIVPLIAIIIGILGIGLPVTLFQIARKWSQEHRELAGPILVCCTLVAMLGLVIGLALLLTLTGWLPPFSEILDSIRSPR